MHRSGWTLGGAFVLAIAASLTPPGAAAWEAQARDGFREELRRRLNLSKTPERSEEPDMATCEDDVYVVFRDEVTGNGDIYLRKSNNRGESFGQAKLVGGGDAPAFNPRIACQGERVYVTWGEEGFGLRFRASDDGARSFGPTLNLDPEGGGPRIAADGCDVYVAWNVEVAEDERVLRFRASHNCGRSFGPIRTLVSGIDLVQLIAVDQNVYILGMSAVDDVPEIFFSRSTNEGRTFSSFRNLSESPGQPSQSPRMEVEGNNVYVVWDECDDFFPTFCDVVFRRSTNEGGNFGPRVTLSDSEGFAVVPDVAAEGDHVYVVWQDDESGPFDIFLRMSDDEGRTFERARNLSRTPGESLRPRISAEQRFVRVIWEDTTPGPTDLFYRASGDFAEHFAPVRNLSESPGANVGLLSYQILSSKDGKNGYVVWVEEIIDNLEVFFRSTEVQH